MKDFKLYWSNKSYSGHRYNTSSFYKKKVNENLSLISDTECQMKIIDLGCGAGELLVELVKKCNICEAIDYSSEMIKTALKNVPERESVSIFVADIKKYVKHTDCEIWFACESFNQYLKQDEVEEIISDFVKSPYAKTMCLFDTIDPDKYQLWEQGRGRYDCFIPSRKQIIKINLQGLVSVLTKQYEKEMIPIGEMGYAYRPHFWMQLIEKYNLDLEIVSSQVYEYRYHVIIRKYQDINSENKNEL